MGPKTRYLGPEVPEEDLLWQDPIPEVDHKLIDEEAGHDVTVPFTPGRADATAEQTDEESFEWLEPDADGFRNYYDTNRKASPEELLVDKAQLLTLRPPEMTVLVGGMRTLDANYDQSDHGVFTDRPGTLTNDFVDAWSKVMQLDRFDLD